MYLVALLEKTPGGWRAWIPTLPGCEATGATEADAEAVLRPLARERVAALKTPAERAHVARLKAIDLSIRVRRPDLTPPLPELDVETRDTLVSQIDALLESRRIPRDLLNALFSFRVELVHLHPELDEEPPDDVGRGEVEGFGFTLSLVDEMPVVGPQGRATRLRLVARDDDGTPHDGGTLDVPEDE